MSPKTLFPDLFKFEATDIDGRQKADIDGSQKTQVESLILKWKNVFLYTVEPGN